MTKVPSCVSRVLDEDDCPPFTVHDIRDYPVHYDALYFPQYHDHIFATARSFCSWLLMSLAAHHRSCMKCAYRFSGCVTFDGVRIAVSSHDVSASLSLDYFERSGYCHCSVFRELRRRSLGDCFVRSLDRQPPWLFSSEDTILSQLDSVSVSILSQTATRLACVGVGRGTKKKFIRAVCQHYLRLRTTLLAKSSDEAASEFSSVRPSLPASALCLFGECVWHRNRCCSSASSYACVRRNNNMLEHGNTVRIVY